MFLCRIAHLEGDDTGRRALVEDGSAAPRVRAIIRAGNPLRDEVDFAGPAEAEALSSIAWSGTLAADLFAEEPRNWMGPGAAALDRWCDLTLPRLEQADTRLLLRPHARHVLSDVPSAQGFFNRRAGQPFGLALAPFDLIAPSMEKLAEDHLRRIVEALGPLAEVVFVDRSRGETEHEPQSTADFPSHGLRVLLACLLREHAKANAAVALPEHDADAAEWRNLLRP